MELHAVDMPRQAHAMVERHLPEPGGLEVSSMRRGEAAGGR